MAATDTTLAIASTADEIMAESMAVVEALGGVAMLSSDNTAQQHHARTNLVQLPLYVEKDIALLNNAVRYDSNYTVVHRVFGTGMG
ncbi:hypothetical protein PF003_g25398 [Phytophthora fragariae]|nr:hypothetical protein PF003_g25398 [Phytophthora fragariae]